MMKYFLYRSYTIIQSKSQYIWNDIITEYTLWTHTINSEINKGKVSEKISNIWKLNKQFEIIHEWKKSQENQKVFWVNNNDKTYLWDSAKLIFSTCAKITTLNNCVRKEV